MERLLGSTDTCFILVAMSDKVSACEMPLSSLVRFHSALPTHDTDRHSLWNKRDDAAHDIVEHADDVCVKEAFNIASRNRRGTGHTEERLVLDAKPSNPGEEDQKCEESRQYNDDKDEANREEGCQLGTQAGSRNDVPRNFLLDQRGLLLLRVCQVGDTSHHGSRSSKLRKAKCYEGTSSSKTEGSPQQRRRRCLARREFPLTRYFWSQGSCRPSWVVKQSRGQRNSPIWAARAHLSTVPGISRDSPVRIDLSNLMSP